MGADGQQSERHPLTPRAAVACWRVLRITWLRFGFSAGVLDAAAIAFFALVCLAPLGILLATVAHLLVGNSAEVHQHITEALSALGPAAAEAVTPHVLEIVDNPASRTVGALSALALIWAGLRLFEAVERTLTGIWPGKVLRSYWHRKLVALAMLVLAGLLLGSFVLFSAFMAGARGWLQRLPGVDPLALHSLEPRFTLVYGFLMSFVAFSVIYKFVPVQRVRTSTALASGLLAALIWHAGSPVFTWMLHNSTRQGAVLGGLANLLVFAIWSFLGAQILVIGAHFAVAFEHVIVYRRPETEDDRLIAWPRSRRQAESSAGETADLHYDE